MVTSVSALQLKKFMRLMTTRLWGRETRVRLSHVLMALLRSSSTVSGNVSEVMVSPRNTLTPITSTVKPSNSLGTTTSPPAPL